LWKPTLKKNLRQRRRQTIFQAPETEKKAECSLKEGFGFLFFLALFFFVRLHTFVFILKKDENCIT
jgi:hypothetical protein